MLDDLHKYQPAPLQNCEAPPFLKVFEEQNLTDATKMREKKNSMCEQLWSVQHTAESCFISFLETLSPTWFLKSLSDCLCMYDTNLFIRCILDAGVRLEGNHTGRA